MPGQILPDHLLELLSDYSELNPPSVSHVVRPIPSSLEFSKAVSRGIPLLYRAFQRQDGAADGVTVDPNILPCRCFTWTRHDLGDVSNDINVAVTPDGRADDLHHVEGRPQSVFLEPAEVQMSMRDFLTKLDKDAMPNPIAEPVYYLQSQNSNLTSTTLESLLSHVPANFSFAADVLGQPDAINLWIGDERSVTSTHRDPYENLYLVLKGSKTFRLFPPVDELVLPTEHVLTGRYVYDSHKDLFTVEVNDENESTRIPWIALDPAQPRSQLLERCPGYAHASPRVVTVNEGEILYLPGGWYHHVQQECGIWQDGSKSPCIAVNYWYDPDYEGEKYAMRQLISRLAVQLKQ